MNLKDNLKKIRKDNNLSQEDLAEKLNVSRQSVSKWEQGLAYPEMDKVLQICKMFNLNIDEFLNQDINQVEKNKQSKTNVNKYIDDFLAFVTKTVKMFCAMSFKEKVKCIIEQCFIVFILFILSAIIGSILTSIFESLFGFINGDAYGILYHIFEGIYYIIYTVFAVIVLLHIFKIRYLDYYEMADKEETVEEKEEESKEEKKNTNRKEEKVIIRDPKHSGDRFINGIVKVFVFLVKCFLVFVGLNFCAAVVGFAMLLVLSFTFVKTGLLFLGGFLGCLAGICLNLVILYIIYCFISNTKVKKMLAFIIFAASLLVGGLSIGLMVSGFKDFTIENDINSKYLTTTTEEIDMNKNYILADSYDTDIEFVESNNKNLKIEYRYSKACSPKIEKEENIIYFTHDCDGKFIKNIIKELNDKTFVNPELFKVTIYTNKDNIKVLKSNFEKYKKDLENTEIRELYNKINKLENELNSKDNQINDLEIKLEELK